jgi:hypothetical protein
MAGDDLLDEGASLTPPPWTPEVGPLVRVRQEHVRKAAVNGILGLAVLASCIIIADDLLAETAIRFLVCFAVYWLATHAWEMLTDPEEDRDPTPPSMDTAAPVPSDVPISPWPERFVRSPLWTGALLGLLALLVLFLVVFDEDGNGYVIVSSFSLVEAVRAFRRGRTIAKWEDEHGVELLRAQRRGSGSPAYYVRSRSVANGNPEPQP